jgi:hypothetical protein
MKPVYLFIYSFLGVFLLEMSAQEKAQWIWYPGDFEIWLHTETAGRRQERGQPYPPFWRVDSPYGLVRFYKDYETAVPETARILADGKFQLRIDGGIVYDFDPRRFLLPAGEHSLEFLVENYRTFPSLFMDGQTVKTDGSWQVTNQNQVLHPVGTSLFTCPQQPPSAFSLVYESISGQIIQKNEHSVLFDFGKETFGKIIVAGSKGKGKLRLYYGETRQEALAETQAETYDILSIARTIASSDTTAARAFRYIYAVNDPGVERGEISALYEYLPVEYKGSFECSDSLLNRIYDVSTYTLHLNTREFHLDGIKRDRWIWSGDAYQSYLMNFYSFFDEEVNKRTLFALRGHDPVETHINTILDYSFYWLIGIYDHFFYTGDTAFVRQIYPRMKTLMEFCLNRANQNGFVEGLPGDWVFIDWAPIKKTGEVSFEQLLLVRGLEAVAQSASLAGDEQYASWCLRRSEQLSKKIFETFWNDEKNALLHSRENGLLSETVTRYANLFAILFGYADPCMKKKIRDHVILNDDILPITTPYMKFYELATLCEIDEKEKAIEFVKDYWGGMLKLGATTIWEAYDPSQSGDEHYAMYDRPFGKSLCHAWGANPVYLFGKYLLGVKPTSPGYRTYLIEPSLAGLEWIKGKVPTPDSVIEIFMDKNTIKVKAAGGRGIIRIKSKQQPQVDKGTICTSIGDNLYEIHLNVPQKEYHIRYLSVSSVS